MTTFLTASQANTAGEWRHGYRPAHDPTARTSLDTAIGVLMGRRRCPQCTAFNEIAALSRQTGIGLNALSEALVNLASGVADGFRYQREAEAWWADLLG